MKRGLVSPWVHSALPITRRRRDQLSRVDQRKSRNTRAGLPVACAACRASSRAALERFHVQDADGRLITGGQAFVVLWTALPGYSWIGRLFRLRPLAWTIDRAYDRFLKWRPRL